MKAVALITEDMNTDAGQWQFDKVMSAIAYDVELIVVFISRNVNQSVYTKAWNCLSLYGVDEIYSLNTQDSDTIQSLIHIRKIDVKQLNIFIHKADIIL